VPVQQLITIDEFLFNAAAVRTGDSGLLWFFMRYSEFLKPLHPFFHNGANE
jgi:hypothetical protein